MVAIIDDREDVWGRCPNLVHVKPYVFFSGTSDINAPPPLVPTSATPSSSLPSTPTTPRPFFGGTNQSSGVVPHGQPRPFKMRHILKRVRPVQKHAQPQSDLASSSHRAEGSGTPVDEQQQHQSPVESRLNERDLADDGKMCETNNGRLVGGTNKNQSTIHDTQFISTPNNNTNNNNSKRRSGGDGTESDGSDSDDEGGTEDTGEGGGNEGGQVVGQVGSDGKREGRRGKGDGGSSSSSSDSSNDSEDSSSSGSSSAMDDSLLQDVKLPSTTEKVGVDVGGKVADMNVPAESVAEKQDSDTMQKVTKKIAETTEQKDKKHTVEIEDTDSFLVYLGDVLERIHSIFYAQFSNMMDGRDITTMLDTPTPDLKTIIPEMRHSLLKGAKILFTGVIPTNIPPQRSPIWNTARAFGAIVHDKLVPGLGSTNKRVAMKATTHVIAGKSGTAKLKEAKRVAGVKIVNPRWLWSCAEQWRWLDEKQFPVEADEGCIKEEKKEDAKKKHGKEERDSKSKAGNAADRPVKENNLQMEKEGVSTNDKPGRRSRLDSRISVSDEELERMEAEVNAEMGSSSSSGEEQEEQLGSKGGSVERSSEDVLNYEHFTGDSGGSATWETRKRKHAEIDDSSRSNSPQSNSEPRANSDSSDDEDVLAALLEEDSAPL
jgi:RNA polymerase II subunit A-like phosphatase